MQEETMEKSRSSSAALCQTKSAAGDQRKVDIQSRYNRFSHKKENVAYNKNPALASRYPPCPQRYKETTDKRPRSKSGVPYDQACDYGEEIAHSPDADVNSALPKGSKKGNLNHLLNFKFNPRECGSDGWRPKVPRKRRTSHRMYNKEQFLQANCQFVVADSGDYKIHSINPDKLVDWNLIEQVRVFDYEVPSCPICLYPPRAARITRCGHVYCWSCILHYLSLDDSSWRKCPICYESIHRRDLKSVRSMATHQFTPGQQMSLRLMKKRKGSTVISPISQTVDVDSQNYLLKLDAAADTCYSKILIADADLTIELIIRYERSELISQKIEEQDSLESSFVDLALTELAAREVALQQTSAVRDEARRLMTLEGVGGERRIARGGGGGAGSSRSNSTSPVADDTVPEMAPQPVAKQETLPRDPNMIVYSCAFSDETAQLDDLLSDMAVGDPCRSGNPIRDVTDEVMRPAVPPLPTCLDYLSPTQNNDNNDYFYFFQASDGQQIYLHSLNARCLMMEYGGLEHCPEYISGRVEALESVSMTEELRRRLRYLNHLPLTCEFQFVELHLTPPIVSPNTIKAFEGEFEQLRKQRQRKARDEKRLSKRIDREERLRSGMDTYRHTRIVYSAATAADDPTPGGTHAQSGQSPPLSSQPTICSVAHGEGIDAVSGFVGGYDDVGPSVPSFAQMLRTPSGAAPQWPRVNTKPAPPNAHHRTRLTSAPSGGDENHAEDESAQSVPDYRDAFSEAFRAAFDSLDAQEARPTAQEPVANLTKSEQGRKNRKQKKTLLFTTTMNRAL